MQKIIASTSISLDGYSEGPTISREYSLGEGGPQLHAWLWQPDGPDRDIREFTSEGATIIGKTMFTVGE